jgi:hypothetical protein
MHDQEYFLFDNILDCCWCYASKAVNFTKKSNAVMCARILRSVVIILVGFYCVVDERFFFVLFLMCVLVIHQACKWP